MADGSKPMVLCWGIGMFTGGTGFGDFNPWPSGTLEKARTVSIWSQAGHLDGMQNGIGLESVDDHMAAIGGCAAMWLPALRLYSTCLVSFLLGGRGRCLLCSSIVLSFLCLFFLGGGGVLALG